MKKFMALLICLLLVTVCFTGCKYTGEELYRRFAENHKAGMTKQEVFDELGCPNGYIDIQGNPFSSKTTTDFKANVLSDKSVEWRYECDADHYYTVYHVLIITFDSEGKSVNVYLTSYS